MSSYCISTLVDQFSIFWKAFWYVSCVVFISFRLSHFSIRYWSICWICGSIHCVHSLVIESPWTNHGLIHQDRYHLFLVSLTLSHFFFSNLACSNPCDCVSPRAHDRKMDQSTKIDSTYALVKIFIFAPNWLYSWFNGWMVFL